MSNVTTIGNSAPTVGIPEFYIAATASLPERHPRALKHGDTFAVFDPNGDILSGAGSPDGLFHADTRHLSHFDLTLAGERPMLLSSNLREDNVALACDLANPDLFESGRLVVERDLIHVGRTKFLWEESCHERLFVRNFSTSAQRIRLMLRFAADFADLFEVRGSTRQRRGTYHEPVIGQDRVTLSYTGLDGVRRVTLLRFDPAPSALGADHAIFDLDLEARGSARIYVEIALSEDRAARAPVESFLTAMRGSRRALRNSASRATAVETSNDVFNEVARQTVADLYMLITDKKEGPYPYAGIPWFSTVFGRDGLITALEVLWMDPKIARGVLRFLAHNQATEEDPAADAEPGKILHEMRQGEMARLGEVPFRRYYGSVDSTPLFVLLAGAYLERTGDLDTIQSIWPNIRAALDWMDRYGDRDGDGFIEYGRRTEHGLVNQGWKDSHDSVFHADGTLAKGPIALCEVQGYAYAARRYAAAMARRLGEAAQAVRLDEQAEGLRQHFEACFWDERLATYVLALDGDKRPCAVRTSNAGHALLTGIASPERAERLTATLMDHRTFSGWGIRTLATSEARFNPMSYHNGSIWPHDNALIALGLARYGFKEQAARVLEGLFAAAEYMELRRLPELFCGFRRQRGRGPTLYPVACSPQAWAAVAPMAVLQACLGLSFDPERQTVQFDRPMLPAFLGRVVLRRLAFGEASVDVQIHRYGDEVALHVLERRGEIRVTTTS